MTPHLLDTDTAGHGTRNSTGHSPGHSPTWHHSTWQGSRQRWHEELNISSLQVAEQSALLTAAGRLRQLHPGRVIGPSCARPLEEAERQWRQGQPEANDQARVSPRFRTPPLDLAAASRAADHVRQVIEVALRHPHDLRPWGGPELPAAQGRIMTMARLSEAPELQADVPPALVNTGQVLHVLDLRTPALESTPHERVWASLAWDIAVARQKWGAPPPEWTVIHRPLAGRTHLTTALPPRAWPRGRLNDLCVLTLEHVRQDPVLALHLLNGAAKQMSSPSELSQLRELYAIKSAAITKLLATGQLWPSGTDQRRAPYQGLVCGATPLGLRQFHIQSDQPTCPPAQWTGWGMEAPPTEGAQATARLLLERLGADLAVAQLRAL